MKIKQKETNPPRRKRKRLVTRLMGRPGGLVGRGRSAKLGHGPVGGSFSLFLLAFFSFYLFSFLFYIILKYLGIF